MKEIATLAGVSRPAVSVVLNGRSDSSIKVSKEKREKILDLARNLKYRPNFAALQLTGKRDRSIGVIAGSYQGGVSAEFNRQLSIILRLENYQTYFVGITDPKHELDTINDFISRGMSGIISNYTLNEMNQSDYPLPIVGVSEMLKEHDVAVDAGLGAHTLTLHLIAHGHRKIVFLCNALRYNTAKYEGFRRACREMDLPVLEKDVLMLCWDEDFAAKIHRMIRKDGVTAFFASSDMLAGEFIAWLLDQGYRVPEDVAVVGFDGLEIANITRVPLTTVIQPVRELAEQTVKILLEKIDSQRCGVLREPVLVPPRFRLSGSCGCPSRKKEYILWEWVPISLESGGHNIRTIPPQFNASEKHYTVQELNKLNTSEGIEK